MPHFNLYHDTATDKLIAQARRTMGRIRSHKRIKERLPLIIAVEETIARLRTYNAVGRLYGKFALLYDLEQSLKRVKSTPGMKRELWL